jgi:hypothetical protein
MENINATKPPAPGYNYEHYRALDAAANYGESAAFQARVTFDQHERRTESAYVWAREAAHAAFRACPDLR